MAYVLGFFTADGNMIRSKRGAYFISFEITDRELLEQIRSALDSNHKITVRKRRDHWKAAYRLQIGSKEIFKDLILLGLSPNKSKIIRLPKVPDNYFFHFLRGYFDGDGNIVARYFTRSNRKRKLFVFRTRFTSGNELFLEDLKSKLKELVNLRGSIFWQDKNVWVLSYGAVDSKILFSKMYDRIPRLIFLERKYKTYLRAVEIQTAA